MKLQIQVPRAITEVHIIQVLPQTEALTIPVLPRVEVPAAVLLQVPVEVPVRVVAAVAEVIHTDDNHKQ
jgi:hypothetical protein